MRILLGFIILLNISCEYKPADESTPELSHQLIVSEQTLVIPIDRNKANISSFLINSINLADPQDQGRLYSINQFDNGLEIYSIEDKLIEKRLFFEIEGPKGVGNLMAVYPINSDSIVLFSRQNASIYIANGDGELILQKKFTPPLGFDLPSFSNPKFTSVPAVYNGSIYFKALAPGNYGAMSNDDLAKSPLGYSINLENGKSDFLPFKYPADYWANFKKHYEYSMAFDSIQHKLIFSFFGDHNVYLGDLESGVMKSAFAKSKYFDDNFERLPLDGTVNDRRRYLTVSQHYGNVIYDPIRKVYYRFAFPKLENVDVRDYRDIAFYPNSFSIIVLNQEMEVIAEKLFEDEYFLPSNAFIGRDGLYISMNHPKNESNNEDYFSFKLLKLEPR